MPHPQPKELLPMNNLSDQDFQTLVNFVKQSYGIDLSKKKTLVMNRLTDLLKPQGFSNFHDYIQSIVQHKNDNELELLLNKLTTNYTYFMREETHFHYFQNTILPHLEQTKKDKVLSIWSAGCSTGQEPYVLSMLMKDYFGTRGSTWDTRVLATDISMNALGKAIKGSYAESSLKDIPPQWLDTYFSKNPITQQYDVCDDIKRNVIFRPFNLMDPIKFKLPFDVIFCRNVMIYFDRDTKKELVDRFYNVTVPGGYLFIGHSEGLSDIETKYQYQSPAMYQKL